jgi:hypothetical protein
VVVSVDADNVRTVEDGFEVELSIRDISALMAPYHRKGVLGALLLQLANNSLTFQVGRQVVDYLKSTNAHPTLIQGMLNVCWVILVQTGYFLESAVVDARLEAGKKLTTKLAKLVDEGELGGELPCI